MSFFILTKPGWHCFSNETSPLTFCPSCLTCILAVHRASHIYHTLYVFYFAYVTLLYIFLYHMNIEVN